MPSSSRRGRPVNLKDRIESTDLLLYLQLLIVVNLKDRIESIGYSECDRSCSSRPTNLKDRIESLSLTYRAYKLFANLKDRIERIPRATHISIRSVILNLKDRIESL